MFNAFALWLRFEGAGAALLDSWAAVPPSFLGPQLLRRLAAPPEKELALWTDLLPAVAASATAVAARPVSSERLSFPSVPLSSAPRSVSRKQLVPEGFSHLEAAPAPPLADWRARALDGWMLTGTGLRAALVAELDMMEQAKMKKRKIFHTFPKLFVP